MADTFRSAGQRKSKSKQVACVMYFTLCGGVFVVGVSMLISAWKSQELMKFLYSLLVTLPPLIAALVVFLVIIWRR